MRSRPFCGMRRDTKTRGLAGMGQVRELCQGEVSGDSTATRTARRVGADRRPGRWYSSPTRGRSRLPGGTLPERFRPAGGTYPRSREAMTLNRWKILACTLTVGVGGLAVFAMPPVGDKTDPAKEPAPLPDLTVKPTSPPNGSDTPAPDTPDLDIPIPPVPAKTEEKDKKPSTEPVFEPIAPPVVPIVPVKAEEPARKDEKTPVTDKVPDVAVPPVVRPLGGNGPKPSVPALDPPKPDPAKTPIPDIDVPAVTPVVPPSPLSKPTTASTPATVPDKMRIPIVPSGPTTSPDTKDAKLKLTLRMGD